MNIVTLVTNIRKEYHLNMLDVNNVLNQMHIISDDKANENNKKHVMTLFTDIYPRLGLDVMKAMETE